MATQAKPDLTSGAPDHGARHVAIIMDGNGRWAKKRFLPRIAGHRAGVEAVRRVARAARELGLECLTLYRSEEHTSELQSLMRISYAVFCLNKKQYMTIGREHGRTQVNNPNTNFRHSRG